MSDRLWYFAYGSNMQSATFRGRRGIAWTRAIAARLSNWRLVLDKPPLVPADGHGFANIVSEDGAEVLGVAYELSHDDMAHVDLTEGVLIGNYRRIEVEVAPLVESGALALGVPFAAFTLASDRRDATLRPSDVYMALLIEGATEHGLPADYVELLRRIATGEESEVTRAARALVDEGLRAMRRRDG